ncbi:uncharacterized protein N7525_005655 [Penicillium rubens]|uniref:uncharacterized protein n=1 Tax=Penicillium rubens TaxID=1108849 RepID=UPI002A59B020|nr:uncharacterized protein N7525_005655 [Penicillium rubens]KAJ5840467.1 hypothetical protein N7525_005655 [Penicillium rubens]KAJ5868445.1 hypothetical protein N7534_002998 [Penicillium rubens]
MTIYDLHTCLTKIILYSGYLALVEASTSKRSAQAAVQTTLGSADINLTIEVILSCPGSVRACRLLSLLGRFSAEVVPGLRPSFIEQHALGDIKNGLPIQRWDGALGGIGRSSTRT